MDHTTPKDPLSSFETPVVSFVVPAFNEEAWLPDTLAQLKTCLRDLDRPGEIIVVDNNSTDRTSEIAKSAGARVFFEPFNQISRARNLGARQSLGKYLFFVDADTLVPSKLVGAAMEHLENGACCGGGSTVEFDKPQKVFFLWTLKFWNWLSLRFKLAAGSFIFCAREGFEAIGGFSENVFASEELWFSIALRRWGRERGLPFVILEDQPVVTSSRKIEWSTLASNLFLLIFVPLFPLFVRSRTLCFLWYKRPKSANRPPLADKKR